MALRQPNSNPLWSEPNGSGSAASLSEMQLVDDGVGGFKLEHVSVGSATAARMLADGAGGFKTHVGDDNPSGLDELRFLDLGAAGILTYE